MTFRQRASALIRSNIALAALCVISISLLIYILDKPSGGASSSRSSVQTTFPVVMTGPIPMGGLQTELKDLPPPSTFRSFVYELGDILTISGVCQDSYRVTMVFASGTDYRSDPSAAIYNQAVPCDKGQSYANSISLDSLRLSIGAAYYSIQASEGPRGTWYNPR